MSCNICIEKFNNITRKKVSCVFCSYEACKSCWKTYFLSVSDNAKCMNRDCDKYFTRKFLVNNFDANFLNKTYKNHLGDVLVKREKKLLPLTQKEVEKIKEKENFMKNLVNINQKLMIMKKETPYKTKEIEDLKKEMQQLSDNHNIHMQQLKEVKKFIKKCPLNECRGFLSTHWKCGMCGIKACKDCHEVIKDEHKCNLENVESIKMLEKDTKSCPSCSSLVHKISGCDQMFCVVCKTAFDWKTKKILKGVIHNPHYFDWMTHIDNMIHNNNNNECVQFDHTFPLFYGCGTKHPFHELCREILHIEGVTIVKYRPQDIESLNEKVRIKYLLNEIDENTFKKTILKNNKKNELNIEITHLLNLYRDASIDIFMRFRDEFLKKPKHLNWDKSPHKEEYIKLKNYVLKCLSDTMDTFGSLIKVEKLLEA